MTYTKLPSRAGVTKDDSPLEAELTWTDADKIRFVGGLPETIYGWERASVSQLLGICRGAFTYADNARNPIAAFGTHLRLYTMDLDGNVADITPRVAGPSTAVLTFASTIAQTSRRRLPLEAASRTRDFSCLWKSLGFELSRRRRAACARSAQKEERVRSQAPKAVLSRRMVGAAGFELSRRRRADKKKSEYGAKLPSGIEQENGRGGGIRTRDIQLPKLAVYQADLRPDGRIPSVSGGRAQPRNAGMRMCHDFGPMTALDRRLREFRRPGARPGCDPGRRPSGWGTAAKTDCCG
jgi:hypothetical protein